MAQTDNDLPIFDALDGLVPPHQQQYFFGHHEAEKDLLDAWNSGKMHHAWLLTGPKGIGKATFAYRAARFIFNEGSGNQDTFLGGAPAQTLHLHPDNHANRLVCNLAHPNLLVIDRPYDEKTKKFKTEIPVDQVRKTVRFFGSTAGESTWRVCIVDPADDLNGSAANALLKILEEPPKQTVFFLVSHAPGRLLPTIRSRCRRLSLHPLEMPALGEAISTLEIAEGETIKHLSDTCEGSLRKAAELQSDEGLVVIHAFERLLKPPFNPDYEGLVQFADIITQRGKEQRFDNFSDLVHRHLSRQLRSASRNENVRTDSLYPLSQAWEKAGQMIRETQIFNLDKKQTIIDVMRMIAKASRTA